MVRSKGICLVWALLLAAGVCRAADIQFPFTVEKVWYREADRPFLRGFKAAGDLVVRKDTLEFVHPKEGWSIPLREITLISLGTMKGDVNTEWVVLALTGGEGRRIGIRDGHKMGYGAETRKIYDLMLEVARDEKVAQFNVPPGLVPYEPLHRMIAFAVPEGWKAFQLSKEIHDGFILPLGRTGFSPSEVSSPAAWSGTTPRLLVERTDVREYKKATCRSGLTRRLIQRVRTEIGEDRYHLESQPYPVGPCRGIRFRGVGLSPEAGDEQVDLVAVVGNGVLYRVGMISRSSDQAMEAGRLLEQVLGTVRLARPF